MFSPARLNTIADAVAASQLSRHIAALISASPTIAIPRIAAAEDMTGTHYHASPWDQFYWKYNSCILPYARALDHIPECGLTLELRMTDDEVNVAHISRIGRSLYVDTLFCSSSRAVVRGNHRLIFKIEDIDNLTNNNMAESFDTYNHKGRPLERLDSKDLRERPLAVIPTAIIEAFCRWIAFCGLIGCQLQPTFLKSTQVKGKVKPRMYLKAAGGLDIGIIIDNEKLGVLTRSNELPNVSTADFIPQCNKVLQSIYEYTADKHDIDTAMYDYMVNIKNIMHTTKDRFDGWVTPTK